MSLQQLLGLDQEPEYTQEPATSKRMRRELKELGYTMEDAKRIREVFQLEDGFDVTKYIKYADLERICLAEGISLNRLSRAVGGSRGLLDPIEGFQLYYKGGVRYLPIWCASSEGLQVLRELKGYRVRQSKVRSFLTIYRKWRKADLLVHAHVNGVELPESRLKDLVIRALIDAGIPPFKEGEGESDTEDSEYKSIPF